MYQKLIMFCLNTPKKLEIYEAISDLWERLLGGRLTTQSTVIYQQRPYSNDAQNCVQTLPTVNDAESDLSRARNRNDAKPDYLLLWISNIPAVPLC